MSSTKSSYSIQYLQGEKESKLTTKKQSTLAGNPQNIYLLKKNRQGPFGNDNFKYETLIDDVKIEIFEGDDSFMLKINDTMFNLLFVKEQNSKRDERFRNQEANKENAKQFWGAESKFFTVYNIYCIRS